MDDKSALDKVLIAWLIAMVVVAGVLVAALIGLNGCAPQPLLTRLDTAQKLAQCVEPVVLAELAAREAAADELVERSKADAGAPTPREAVDSIARDAGAM